MFGEKPLKKSSLILIVLLLATAGMGVQSRSPLEEAVASKVSIYGGTKVMSCQSNETVILTLGKIDLAEKRLTRLQSFAHTLGWIEFHQREHFISYNEIFIEFSEKFEWEKVNSNPDLGLGFLSWESFTENLTKTSSWWLEYSWGLRSGWYGIVENETTVVTERFGKIVTITIRCHIRDVSEYLIGHSLMNSVFDFYSVDLGKIEVYEYYYDSTKSGQSVYLHLKAPSTILQQVREKYKAIISIAPQFQNTTSSEERVITFVMPPTTEVESVEPSTTGVFKDNLAVFTVSTGTKFPSSFTVVSGPPKKSLAELLTETLTSPDRILVIAGVVTLLVSSFQGAMLLRRRKAYSRTARLIARIYEENKGKREALNSELTSIHDSLYRMFVEDKITDEQFERLHNLVHEHLPEAKEE